MTQDAQNASQTQAIPGLIGLPEIPNLAADDNGGVRAVAGGQEGRPEGAQANQPAPRRRQVQSKVEPAAVPKAERSKLELVLDAHPHDLVGGRHLAVIDGVHTFLTNHEAGELVLTREGEALAEKLL